MNFLIVYITPPAIRNIGYKTYVIFAVLNACWVPIIYVWYPEVITAIPSCILALTDGLLQQTKGLALEDVDRLFAKHGGDAERRLSVTEGGKYGEHRTEAVDIEKPAIED